MLTPAFNRQVAFGRIDSFTLAFWALFIDDDRQKREEERRRKRRLRPQKRRNGVLNFTP